MPAGVKLGELFLRGEQLQVQVGQHKKHESAEDVAGREGGADPQLDRKASKHRSSPTGHW